MQHLTNAVYSGHDGELSNVADACSELRTAVRVTFFALAVVGISSPNPILTFLGFLVPIFLFDLLWRHLIRKLSSF